MPGLDLSDLGLDDDEPTDSPADSPADVRSATSTCGPAPARGAHADPDSPTLAQTAAVNATTRGASLHQVVRDLGVEQTAECLRRAVHQIWGQRPDLMPFGAMLLTTPTEGDTPVEALDVLLNLRFPTERARRILALTTRHAEAFLGEHLSWSGSLADDGVPYETMNRRALMGEFDASGPQPSRFDLTTMSFPPA